MNNLTFSPTRLAYNERPYRREPSTDMPDSDIYLAAPEERTATVKAALDAGITYFHADYEREAQSLGASLKSLGIRSEITISTTDGDALDRCPDTEAGAIQAIQSAIARKRELLGIDTLDTFLLHDFRSDVHTPARLTGAAMALESARAEGRIKHIGVTCYASYEPLAQAVQNKTLLLDIVIARYNYLDQAAGDILFPTCQALGITTLATHTFSWLGDVPFVRFPNTWRYRNLTKNFYGFTAGQAHLHWVLGQPFIDGALVSMQTPAQVSENVSAIQITKTPQGLDSLFDSFVEAITKTREGWRGLKQDELWEYRMAAETYLSRKRKP
jgi:aryl-alcohol dehydrogenase-like predicted oxidoreductase